MKMCRLCSAALDSTRIALGEITDRLREDEYDMHSLPSDLRMSFMVMAEMARMMHLPGLDSDIEGLAKAVMSQVEPLHDDLSVIALEVKK
ncbi:MAG: hypothetical protein M0Q43_05050 [Methanothrix sp.]|jgi:hypothetical protein|nr:hypothetical protein [Methanothrix sp.]